MGQFGFMPTGYNTNNATVMKFYPVKNSCIPFYLFVVVAIVRKSFVANGKSLKKLILLLFQF
jgi:hypothetical protein